MNQTELPLGQNRQDIAKRTLLGRITLGKDKCVALVKQVSETVIRDRLVPPNSVLFVPSCDDVQIQYGQEPDLTKIHRHAMTQLAAKVELPGTFVRKHNISGETNAWRRELVAHNLNELYGNETFKSRSDEPVRFLHRLVGNELRGFLSRSFNRHLASAPLLRAFLGACGEVGAAPVESFSSSVKVGVSCYLPTPFEPVPGEFVAIGMSWGNSDFGMGSLNMRLSTMRISSGTTAVMEDSLSRVHLGSIIGDSDIEMSNETMEKEAATHMSAIRDTVLKQLSPEPVQKLLNAIEAAHQKEIPWDTLKGKLKEFLNKGELTTVGSLLGAVSVHPGIVDLPPLRSFDDLGNPVPTAYWASTVVSFVAEKVEDPERKSDLQEYAGKLLKG